MEVLVKKTNEISDEEILEVYSLFDEIFHQKRDSKLFRVNYSNTPLGYSYHSILFNDNKQIVGFHSCVPFFYTKKQERFLVALGIDSMVKKEYRDYFNFYNMITQCQKRLKDDGFKLRIGFPNDNSYPVLKKGLKHKDIGKLDTYCLIKNIGGIKSSLSFLNLFFRLSSQILCAYSKLGTDKKIYDFLYKKDRENFDIYRYKWFGGDYKYIKYPDYNGVYKIQEYKGVKTAFLLDVYPLSQYNFDSIIRDIYKKEYQNIDMIIYVGSLPFNPKSLFKIPHKYEPKHFNFTCKPLDDKYFDDSIYDINNWEVNLSNYDLL